MSVLRVKPIYGTSFGGMMMMRQRQRGGKDRKDGDGEQQKQAEKSGSVFDKVLTEAERMPDEPAVKKKKEQQAVDAAAVVRAAKITEGYAYAGMAQKVMAKAAQMTAGSQDNLRAMTVEEVLEAMSRDVNTTVDDIMASAGNYMASSVEAAKREDYGQMGL